MGFLFGLVFGWFATQRAGVYFAMATLALAGLLRAGRARSLRQHHRRGEHADRVQPPRPGAPAWTIDQMYDFFPQLKQRRDTAAGMLSGGEQQVLTMCRSLREPLLT